MNKTSTQLSLTLLLVLLLSHITSASTAKKDDSDIHTQALELAKLYLYGSSRMEIKGKNNTAFFNYAVSRQMKHISKELSVRRWEAKLKASNSNARSPGTHRPSSNTHHRSILDTRVGALKYPNKESKNLDNVRVGERITPSPKPIRGTRNGRTFLGIRVGALTALGSHNNKSNSTSPGNIRGDSKQKIAPTPKVSAAKVRSPKPITPEFPFVAGRACGILKRTTFQGGDLPKGYNSTIKSWPECCNLCFNKKGCHAWTFRPIGGKPGCYLKGYRPKYKYLKLHQVLTDISGMVNKYYERPYAKSAVNPQQSPIPPIISPLPIAPALPSSPSPKLKPSPSPPKLKSPPPPVPSPPPPSPPPPSPPPPVPSPPPPVPSPSPTQIPSQTPGSTQLPAGKGKYAEVLGLAWKFYAAQRSGPTQSQNPIKWRTDSHLNDPIPGGWYDAGDTLKLNFPLSPTVSYLAWGLIEFSNAYDASGTLSEARNELRIAADYLHRSYDPVAKTYVGQIGDPDVDHKFWGRPEEANSPRQAYIYDQSMSAGDLYCAVAGALAASSVAFQGSDSAWSQQILKTAIDMYNWGVTSNGKYSSYYKKQTASIYPSSDFLDSMAWSAGWLFRATNNATYLANAAQHWSKGTPDIFPGWDSQWAPHAIHMIALANEGVVVPGIEIYKDYAENKFFKAWLNADGYLDVIKTPLGMHYPKWNQWANLQFSTTAAALSTIYAKHTTDPALKTTHLNFARSQVDYALGSAGRSYVVGWGNNPPTHPHHAGASCPDAPAPCGWPQFNTKDPNPQILYGALVGGPAGFKKNAANPDDSYQDKRSDYVTNEVAGDYNSFFNTALAGLYQLL